MFEGLDQVNWRKLHHGLGSGENIPALLRTIAEAQDAKSCEIALNRLSENIFYLGGIYDSTYATIPFLLQLLQNQDFPKRDLILRTLIFILNECDWNAKSGQSIADLYNESATFKSIEQGIPIYIALLDDSSDEIRAFATYLIIRTNGPRRGARLRLWRASQREKNPFTQALMIFGIGSLTVWSSNQWVKKVRTQYQERLIGLLPSVNEQIVRVAVVLAWLDSVHPDYTGTLPLLISQIVGDAIAMQIKETIPDQFSFYQSIFTDEEIMNRLLQVGGLKGLTESLSSEHMTAEAAHIIIRRLFDGAFARTWPISGYGVDNGQGSGRQYIYVRHPFVTDRRLYFPRKVLDHKQELVIEAAVNCDVFWQISTNLFSFFYGLPDSRDELRVLLTVD